jgi:hypothetical protein
MISIDLKEHIADIGKQKECTIRLSRVTVNCHRDAYDLGRWSPDGKRYNGILMDEQVLNRLKQVLNGMNTERSDNGKK